jgi:hypothetical protein
MAWNTQGRTCRIHFPPWSTFTKTDQTRLPPKDSRACNCDMLSIMTRIFASGLSNLIVSCSSVRSAIFVGASGRPYKICTWYQKRDSMRKGSHPTSSISPSLTRPALTTAHASTRVETTTALSGECSSWSLVHSTVFPIMLKSKSVKP